MQGGHFQSLNTKFWGKKKYNKDRGMSKMGL